MRYLIIKNYFAETLQHHKIRWELKKKTSNNKFI